MAENLVEDINLLVAHMSANGTTWTQTIHAHNVGGGDLVSTSEAVVQFHDFCIANTPNAGFIESISAYKVYQRQEGTTNVEHPPIFTNTYHQAGTHDANYNGSPIGSPLPKDVCVFAKLATSGGRSGKLFIRNLLEESDVDSAVSGTWEFTAGSTRFTVARFATVVTASLATCFVGGEHAADNLFVVAHLLLVKPTDTRSAFFTPISSCTAIKPVWNKAHR